MSRVLGAVREGRSSRKLLATLLDTPSLSRQIKALSPAALGRVVERVGLEDAAEIVALASTSQLVSLWDEDLWKSSRPGEEEEFDAARFVTWLSVLQEAGDAFAAGHVAALSLEFVTHAFNELLLVLNVDVMTEEMEGGGEEVDRIEKALESCAYEELDEFQLIARSAEGWDAVWSLVLALDRDHRDFLRQVLERCCGASHAYIEDNGGLSHVLNDAEMFESDARAERDDRRAERGHVAASDAKSFLALAGRGDTPSERDAVTRAYFRELALSSSRPAAVNEQRAGSRRIERLLSAVEEAAPRRPRLSAQKEKELPLIAALEARIGDAVGLRYREELAYLANVLIEGASLGHRRFRPVEALEAAIAVTNLGLELLPGFEPARAVELLQATSADILFRQGFSVLRREIVDRARVQAPNSSLAEDVPRLSDFGGGGFVATREDLDAATRAFSSAQKGSAKRTRKRLEPVK